MKRELRQRLTNHTLEDARENGGLLGPHQDGAGEIVFTRPCSGQHNRSNWSLEGSGDLSHRGGKLSEFRHVNGRTGETLCRPVE